MLIDRVNNFIKNEIWRVSLKNENKFRAILIRTLQVFLISIRGFTEDKVQLRASALTFYSLLSVVPILAVFFGIAEAFGFDDVLKTELTKGFQGQEDVLEYLLTFTERMLSNTKGGLMAIVAFGVLLWSVMKVMGNIEASFNGIWQIKKSRIFVRKFSDYISLLMIVPLLLVLSTSTNVTAKFSELGADQGLLSYFSGAVVFLINLLPYTLIWILLTLLYIIMPNTKVEPRAGFIAGVFAGTSYQIFQLVYINSQAALSNYSAIYGSFAALPLFLMYMRVSWLIILFGAEISFSIQNVENFEYEADSENLSEHKKKVLILLVLHTIIKSFKNGKSPLMATELAHELEMPIRLTRELLYTLLEAGVVLEAKSDEIKESSYVPSTDINLLTIGYVLGKIDDYGTDKLNLKETNTYAALTEKMNTNLKQFIETNRVLLKDID